MRKGLSDDDDICSGTAATTRKEDGDLHPR